MVSGPPFSHIPSVPHPTSQGVPSLPTSPPSSTSQEMITNNDNGSDLKPIVSGVSLPVRPVGPAPTHVNILNNLSQVRQVMNSAALTGGSSMGLQPMGQTPMGMHVPSMMSSGMASSMPTSQNMLSSAQSVITSVAGSGALQQNSGIGPFSSATSNVSGNSNIGMSQSMNNLQGGVSMGQTVPGMSQANLSGGQVVQSGIGMNPNMMSGLGLSVTSSGTGTMIPTPGMSQQVQSGLQSLGANNSAVSIPLSQQVSSAAQQAQSKYVRVWEVKFFYVRM